MTSVTNFAEMLSVWRNNSLAILSVYLLKFRTHSGNYHVIVHIFIVVNGQKLKNNLASGHTANDVSCKKLKVKLKHDRFVYLPNNKLSWTVPANIFK